MTALAGTVYLVGAGPGDPGLITVRGMTLLRTADVIVHDRLIGPELLDERRQDARLVPVGKTPGRHPVPQQRINVLLVEHAQRGRSVVRLKGGDPYLYGRGWEERAACHDHGVPCEVVPGVTSALAAPAAAAIPVTARGVASSLAIVTPRRESGPATLDYATLAAMDTVCVLMGRGMLEEVTAGLVAAGRDPRTPAALVERGTMAGQRTVVATLAQIATQAADAGLESPAVLVVGAVATLDSCRRAADRGQLAGRRVIVTRPREAARSIVTRLRELGAEAIESPLIRISYRRPSDAGPDLARFRWLVFASRHGVIGLFRWLESRGLDARALASMRTAVVGPATAEELRRFGLRADAVATPHRATALARLVVDGQRRWPGPALVPGGSRAGTELPDALRQAGVEVEAVRVYDTDGRPPEPAALAAARRGVDAILFHSPSAVHAWADADGPSPPLVACIGPTTARAANARGLGPVVVAPDHRDEGLVSLLLERFANAEVTA